MKILVDGDGCPNIRIIQSLARKYKLRLEVFCDTSHRIELEYGKLIRVTESNDAVDFKLINHCTKGDIVITQDFGLASMAMGKGAKVIYANGSLITENDISELEFRRYLTKLNKRRGILPKHKKKRKSTSNFYDKLTASLEACCQ